MDSEYQAIKSLALLQKKNHSWKFRRRKRKIIESIKCIIRNHEICRTLWTIQVIEPLPYPGIKNEMFFGAGSDVINGNGTLRIVILIHTLTVII